MGLSSHVGMWWASWQSRSRDPERVRQAIEALEVLLERHASKADPESLEDVAHLEGLKQGEE